MNKSDRKIFKQFLKDNEAFAEFKHNIFIEYNIDFKTYCKNADSYTAIRQAFAWRKTDQGQYYWEELNDKWENQCITNS